MLEKIEMIYLKDDILDTWLMAHLIILNSNVDDIIDLDIAKYVVIEKTNIKIKIKNIKNPTDVYNIRFVDTGKFKYMTSNTIKYKNRSYEKINQLLRDIEGYIIKELVSNNPLLSGKC
jgi:hypothetical protein